MNKLVEKLLESPAEPFNPRLRPHNDERNSYIAFMKGSEMVRVEPCAGRHSFRTRLKMRGFEMVNERVAKAPEGETAFDVAVCVPGERVVALIEKLARQLCGY